MAYDKYIRNIIKLASNYYNEDLLYPMQIKFGASE